jgi:hypothetical protein
MAYATPGTVASGSVWTAAQVNVLVNDIIDTRAVIVNVKSTSLTTTTTTTVTTGGTHYDISGLSVSITPTSATSKIMIWGQVSVGLAADNILTFRLVRDSTAVGVGTSVSSRIAASAGSYYGAAVMGGLSNQWAVPMQFLDSPATTSAITYKIQTSSNANGQIVYINRSYTDADSIGHFRGVSTITVMEVPV